MCRAPDGTPCVRQRIHRPRHDLPAVAGSSLAHDTATPAKPSPSPSLSATPRLPVIKPASDFTLFDATGGPVRLSALRGRVVLMSFIYTRCTAACPLLTQQMALLHAHLKRSKNSGPAVHFLSITVDPDRDSAEALRRYASRFGVPPAGWQFLREDPERLRPILAAYDEWTRVQPDGDIDHPARLYLIDPRGNIREIYSLSFFDERQAYLDIQALRREPH